MRTLYLVNEYESIEDEIFPLYMRSYVFHSAAEARKFIRIMKRKNLEISGYNTYEFEKENLFDSALDAEESLG